MKKISLALLLVIGFSSFAQNRFFYDYKFIPDSTDKTNVLKEIMLLDIDKSGSKYYGQEKFIADSTSRADLERQLKLSPNNISISRNDKPGMITYKVTKQYPDFKTHLFTKISSDNYKIEEDKKPEWKILPDKQKIGEYNAQKATTKYGGREWTAWFSTDLPFQDGPYKFYGLPGLIVKIEDTTGSHIMTLVGNKKVAQAAASEKEPELPQNIRVFGMGGKELEVTEDQFRKAWKDYVNDPAKNMREMMMRNTDNSKMTFKVKTSDGKEMGVWFHYPPNFDPNKKYPTLVYCQGGPQSALTQFFSTRWNFALMAANGYIIVAPNRRGMPGWGTKWNEEISKDWGGQPIRDYLAATDFAKTLPYVDGERVAAVGASYGGYSVFMLAGVHNNRFKTFIAHDGLFDMKSWYLTTEELWFANWDLGSPWEKPLPKAYTEFNPSNFVDKWNKPIMIFQGGIDFRVGYEQGQEAFQAAKLRGLKSKFVYFPNENHWVLHPQNGLVWQREFFDWLKETL